MRYVVKKGRFLVQSYVSDKNFNAKKGNSLN